METLSKKKDTRINLSAIGKKQVNIAIFGHGKVGSALISQILDVQTNISKRRNLQLNIFAIANSRKILFSKSNFQDDWNYQMVTEGSKYEISDVIAFAKTNNLDNLIAVDNTACPEFIKNYPIFIEAGFNLISSNKIGNTVALDFYNHIRTLLHDRKKEYLYETNVGAGLPLVDTIKLLHLSGENITRIKGVFSGSLSYLFNTFSASEQPFSKILQKAVDLGYTEPDPREDLCGNDVGRKLLILARELDLHNEFEDVQIHNLIPNHLRKTSKEYFLEHLTDFDVPFSILKKNQKPNHVLRYIGDLHGDLSKNNGAHLVVSLRSVPKESLLGQVKGSDSIFEIYTESYGNNPIVIQGAGAGAAVTARGVLGDILRLSDKLN